MGKVVNLFKKGTKYTILLSIKEAYLFVRNLIGLWAHPFKTLHLIAKERDYSQAVLIFGLPFYGFILGAGLIIYLRILINAPHQWGGLAKGLFLVLVLICGGLFVYLSYWFKKVYQLKRLREKSE